MGKRTTHDNDQWFGVHDAKKRKQIQDRLAQRARRERLAQSKCGSRISSGRGAKTKVPTASQGSTVIPLIQMKPAIVDDLAWCSIPLNTSITVDHALLPLPNHTVYSALFHNGVILGLACGSSGVSVSKPALPHVPESLRPTQIQLDHVHFAWIDRFPLPALRNRMILCSDSFNVEKFLADLFTTTTFILTPGCSSWDPKAWHPSEEFKREYAFLFTSKNAMLPEEIF